MRDPNFFLVGAAKSGTTTLYRALQAHHDVYLPAVKEPHVYAYLADPEATGPLYADAEAARRRYRELYHDASDQTAVGDASTTSLVIPGAAAAIARDVPSARIVAILRHPVDRAFSHYNHFVGAGGEELRDFAQAIRAEESRQAEGFPFTYRYLHFGRYSEQLPPFLELFGRERVLVHLYDDLCTDAEAVIRATLRFLAVDDSGSLSPIGRNNDARSVRNAAAGRRSIARRTSGALSRLVVRRPSLDPNLRAELTAAFAEEISALEHLLCRDLSAWR